MWKDRKEEFIAGAVQNKDLDIMLIGKTERVKDFLDFIRLHGEIKDLNIPRIAERFLFDQLFGYVIPKNSYGKKCAKDFHKLIKDRKIKEEDWDEVWVLCDPNNAKNTLHLPDDLIDFIIENSQWPEKIMSCHL